MTEILLLLAGFMFGVSASLFVIPGMVRRRNPWRPK